MILRSPFFFNIFNIKKSILKIIYHSIKVIALCVHLFTHIPQPMHFSFGINSPDAKNASDGETLLIL
jgi:hypothetical protein